MSKKILSLSLAALLCNSVALFSTPTPESMRAATAVQHNSRLASSINVTKDADNNVISFHVNGANPADAEILLKQDASPLSSEYTVVIGKNKDGGSCCYMLPTNVATASVVESISKELVNSGAISIEITNQKTGKEKSGA